MAGDHLAGNDRSDTAAQAAERDEMTQVSAAHDVVLNSAELLHLDMWADAVEATFSQRAYIVGHRHRLGLDVHLPLPDDDPVFADPSRLRLFQVSVSAWARQMTGVNVDFEFQKLSDWNATGGPVTPLGGRWRRGTPGECLTLGGHDGSPCSKCGRTSRPRPPAVPKPKCCGGRWNGASILHADHCTEAQSR